MRFLKFLWKLYPRFSLDRNLGFQGADGIVERVGVDMVRFGEVLFSGQVLEVLKDVETAHDIATKGEDVVEVVAIRLARHERQKG
jgi:hypothetical protein